MIIPSGGCDAMHAAVSYEALRRERDELKAALAKVTAERDAMQLSENVLRAVGEEFNCRTEYVAMALVKYAEYAKAEKEGRLVVLPCKELMAREICEGLCMDCPMSKECLCGNCVGGSNFEFAGVKKEETK